MKTIAFAVMACMLMVLSGSALADMNVTNNIQTTGEVNLETNVQTDGNVEVWIDGTNIGDAVGEMGNAINGQGEYILANEDKWLQDDEGITKGDLVDAIHGAIGFLFGNHASDHEEQIAADLDSYFSSDQEMAQAMQRLNNLELEAEAVSRTLTEIAPDAYCQAKIDMMIEYGFDSVNCADITYYHWIVHNSPEVTRVIGVNTQGNGYSGVDRPDLGYVDVPENLRDYVPGLTRPIIIDHSPDGLLTTKDEFNLFALTNAPTVCQYSEEYFEYGEGHDFQQGQKTRAHETLVELSEGSHEYYIRCSDAYGKVAYSASEGAGHAVSSVTRDTTPPELSCSINEQALAYGASESATVSCRVTDLTEIVAMELAGFGSFESCGEAHCFAIGIDDAEEGRHSLSVRAEDMAGNEALLMDFATIDVDKTPLPEEPGPLENITRNITGFITSIFNRSNSTAR